MKRIAFLTTLLLISAVFLLPFGGAKTADAEQKELVVGLGGGTTEDGVYIDVTLWRNPGITAVKFRLEYDKTALVYDRVYNLDDALSGMSFTASGTDVSVDDVRFMYGPSALNDGTGLLARIYFKIADNAADGAYKVNLVAEDALGANKENVDVTVNATRVQINGNSVSVENADSSVDGKTVGIVVVCVAVIVLFVVLVAVKASRR